MRLIATDPAARKVVAVLLDGKKVPLVYELDTNAGWVVSYEPILPDIVVDYSTKIVTEDEESIPEMEGMRLVRRYGKVEIIFNEQEDTI